ncbi:hypothetical protein L9F63_015814 [Diploptera punctata]|uniref:Uncharacterized protein n=1 Tax=Diploptera punctata TaxID=6984 RepID=A0AAD8EK52_DIPPU|nr:hypothetical protein L9F63_015814 [Diploptera punctata]
MEPVCTCNERSRINRRSWNVDNKEIRPNGFLGSSRSCFLIKESRRSRRECKSDAKQEDTSTSSSSGELWDEDMLLRHIKECRCTCNHMGYGNYLDWIEVSQRQQYF